MSVFDPVTNPDVQEALSRRYGNAGIYVLPLKSGNYALFARDMQLVEIVPHEDIIPERFNRLSHDLDLQLSTAAAARFYGEPDAKALARDIRKANRPILTQPTIDDLALEI